MPHFHANINAPSDTPVDADDRDWRLAVRIIDGPAAIGSDAESDGKSSVEAEADPRVKTIPRSQFESGQDFAVEVLVDNRVIAVFRHARAWFAIDGMCAHQGGPLADGVVRDGCVTCPWHGWQYDLATGIQMINHQPLQESFPIRQVDDRVEILVTREIAG